MVAFCADEKEVLVAFLNLGYDMKRPEVVTLFGGRGGSALAIAWSTAIGRGPDHRNWSGPRPKPNRFGPEPYGLGTCI